MAAPVFIADSLADAAPGGLVLLTGPEGHHASTVVRLHTGEAVELVDGHGRRAEGVVSEVRKGEVAVTVGRVVDEQPPQPRIVVYQALAKGDRGERAVELMTEVGVDAIIPWLAAHSVSRWRDDKADKGPEKWRSAARTASKQARRAHVPQIGDLATLADVERMADEVDLVLVLDETASLALGEVNLPHAGTIVMVVGPEGGFSEHERKALGAKGARAVSLGPTILRTSTAGAVAAAVVSSTTGRWDVRRHLGEDHARMQP